jgi:glycosyltransferase involved in cell wall biosynthesis
VRNNKQTIKDAIDSVINQSYKNIEYIIIDGASTDGTIEVIKEYKNKVTKFISEKDDGLYDAMNKGIRLATGDIVGILNSDDFYKDNFVIEKIMNIFKKESIDSMFADLIYVRAENLDKTIRYFDSSKFKPSRFAYGFMPAHPTFFVKREVYEKYGLFRTDLKISADFDILVRFLYTHKITYRYLQEVLVKMRVGGVSTGGFRSKLLLNREVLQVCADNNIKTNLFKILLKYPHKIICLFKK